MCWGKPGYNNKNVPWNNLIWKISRATKHQRTMLSYKGRVVFEDEGQWGVW